MFLSVSDSAVRGFINLGVPTTPSVILPPLVGISTRNLLFIELSIKIPEINKVVKNTEKMVLSVKEKDSSIVFRLIDFTMNRII